MRTWHPKKNTIFGKQARGYVGLFVMTIIHTSQKPMSSPFVIDSDALIKDPECITTVCRAWQKVEPRAIGSPTVVER